MTRPAPFDVIRFSGGSADVVSRLAELHENSPKEWDETWVVEPSFLEERTREINSKVGDDDVLFLFLKNEGGKIIGFHWVEFLKEKNFSRIKSLWVDPEYRGKGLGKKLKISGEKWSRHKGASKMITNVHWKNEKMIDLNIANGFNPGFVYLEKAL